MQLVKFNLELVNLFFKTATCKATHNSFINFLKIAAHNSQLVTYHFRSIHFFFCFLFFI